MNIYHFNVKKPGSSAFVLTVAADSRPEADTKVEGLYKKDAAHIQLINQEPGSLEDYVGAMTMRRINKKMSIMAAVAEDKQKARKRALKALHLDEGEED